MPDPLSDAQVKALEQIYRFGLVVPGIGPSVNPKTRDALHRKGYLATESLFGEQIYYHLAERAGEEFEVSDAEIGPLSELEKIRRLAMLRVCLAPNPSNRPLTANDFQSHCPEMYAARMPNSGSTQLPRYRCYYGAANRLGFLRVDMGSAYRRLLAKANRDVQNHSEREGYRELIDEQRFEIAIATSTVQKARRLRGSLEREPSSVPIHVYVVAELQPLLSPPARRPRTKRKKGARPHKLFQSSKTLRPKS